MVNIETLSSIPIIFALVALVTKTFPDMPTRFLPLVTFTVGVIWTLLTTAAMGDPITLSVLVTAIIIGLSPTGLNELQSAILGGGGGGSGESLQPVPSVAFDSASPFGRPPSTTGFANVGEIPTRLGDTNAGSAVTSASGPAVARTRTRTSPANPNPDQSP